MTIAGKFLSAAALCFILSSGASGYNLYDTSTGNQLMKGITGTSCTYSDAAITHIQGEGIFANNWFGLTIAGGLRDPYWWYGNNYRSYKNRNDFYPSGYSCHLDFTKDHPAWNTLLQATLKTL